MDCVVHIQVRFLDRRWQFYEVLISLRKLLYLNNQAWLPRFLLKLRLNVCDFHRLVYNLSNGRKRGWGINGKFTFLNVTHTSWSLCFYVVINLLCSVYV